MRTPQLTARLVTAAPVLLASLGLVAAAGPRAYAASAGTDCSAAYTTLSQFTGGFVATVAVTNTGGTALTGWTVTFTFGGDQQITVHWDAVITQSDENVSATNESFDGSVAAGASTSFGFIGSYQTSDAAPAGLTCTPAN